MVRRLFATLALARLRLLRSAFAQRPLPTTPSRLIFDTDICGDCDDVLALGMIHALQTRGDCKLLAVTVSADHPAGRGLRGCPEPLLRSARRSRWRGSRRREGQDRLSRDGRPEGRRQAPIPARHHDPRRRARGRLACCARRWRLQPDGSVVIVQVGFSTNLIRLLDSKAGRPLAAAGH